MKIEDGCLVTLKVRMSDAQGHLLEQTDAPLPYLHGAQDIFPAVERALAGRAPGDRVNLHLEPADAFGEYDAQLVHLVDRAALGRQVAVGMQVEGLPGASGDTRVYRVTDLAGSIAVLDGNHPLAGMALRFDIEVLTVEPLSAAQRAEAERAVVPPFLCLPGPHGRHPGDDATRH
jgi:FKBP-type peptidyl-prolyl cis-trans isomerase SlyD